MAVQEVKIEEFVQPVYTASRDVLEAVRALILRTEALEEEVLRSALPEVELSGDETERVEKALHEMREEGAGITLDEFNQHQGINQNPRSEVQSHST
ncbi:MAG: hypothetical protein ABSD49_11475 [Candidatus Bathyarchaeia archaeon]|jgi:hypothetical protein